MYCRFFRYYRRSHGRYPSKHPIAHKLYAKTAVYAQASRVAINLTIADNIHFTIEDGGMETTEEQQAQTAVNGRFRLKSMQTRLALFPFSAR